MMKNHVFNPKSRISGIFKNSVLDIKDATFRLSNHFGVKCNSKWGQTNKEDLVSTMVSTSHNQNFGVFW